MESFEKAMEKIPALGALLNGVDALFQVESLNENTREADPPVAMNDFDFVVTIPVPLAANPASPLLICGALSESMATHVCPESLDVSSVIRPLIGSP